MAVRLQFASLVIPRSALARCRGLPRTLASLPPDGGFLCDTTWFDRHLLVETAMDGALLQACIATWTGLGLLGPATGEDGPAHFQDFCVATARQGPLGTCAWLGWDATTGAAWLRDTDPGPVIGGYEDLEARQAALAAWEAQAEAAYTAMYESQHPRDDRDDACLALARAREVAAFLNRREDLGRLQAREVHIRAVYDHQFRR